MKLIRYMPLLRTSCKRAFCACMKYFPTRIFTIHRLIIPLEFPILPAQKKELRVYYIMLLALHTTNERSFEEEKFAKFFVRMKGTTADSQILREINVGDTKSAQFCRFIRYT